MGVGPKEAECRNLDKANPYLPQPVKRCRASRVKPLPRCSIIRLRTSWCKPTESKSLQMEQPTPDSGLMMCCSDLILPLQKCATRRSFSRDPGRSLLPISRDQLPWEAFVSQPESMLLSCWSRWGTLTTERPLEDGELLFIHSQPHKRLHNQPLTYRFAENNDPDSLNGRQSFYCVLCL